MYHSLAILLVFAFLYTVFYRKLENLPISAASIFLIVGVALGPLGGGLLDLENSHTTVRVLADLTLAMLLFSDAAGLNLKTLRTTSHLPTRMLLLGLPMTILLGLYFATVFFAGFTFWECALVAIALAATDAALGKAVVTNPKVPNRLRTTLNVESGLNDGLCVPLLLLAIALSKTSAEPTGLAIKLLLQEIGIGATIGITLAFIGSHIIRYSENRQWISNKWAQIPVTLLALICFTVAQQLHGSGYIAAFIGGLTFCILNKEKRSHELAHDAEESGDILSMLTWILFGAVAIHGFLENFSLNIILYSLLSLTVVRLLPVMLSLLGSNTNISSRVFLSWFGPRGLASVVFAVIIIDSQIPQSESIAHIITCTILLSVFAHGISAIPFINRFHKSME